MRKFEGRTVCVCMWIKWGVQNKRSVWICSTQEAFQTPTCEYQGIWNSGEKTELQRDSQEKAASVWYLKLNGLLIMWKEKREGEPHLNLEAFQHLEVRKKGKNQHRKLRRSSQGMSNRKTVRK